MKGYLGSKREQQVYSESGAGIKETYEILLLPAVLLYTKILHSRGLTLHSKATSPASFRSPCGRPNRSRMYSMLFLRLQTVDL